MRPVDKGQQPATYAPPATLRFSGRNRVLFNKLLGTHTPTMSACLNLWLRVVKAQTAKKKPKGYKNLVIAKDAIEPRVEGTYKCAGLPLTGAIGEFCSYCEVRIAGLLEVEHVLPKSHYPTFAVAWENFLLTCGPCNTSKGNTPGRTTVRKWLGTAIRSETQCHGEVRNRNRYRWPDQNDDTYRLFPVELFADPTDTDTWVPVPFNDAVDPTTVLVSTDVPSKTVGADIPN
jgi:5-methylcytosine-specific restriction endonuclease McrA